jgi:hypothetical protein
MKEGEFPDYERLSASQEVLDRVWESQIQKLLAAYTHSSVSFKIQKYSTHIKAVGSVLLL